MSVIQWNDDFKTGNLYVDNQHIELFSMVNELHDSILSGQGKQKTNEVLDSLSKYVSKHFAAEEALMKNANYPEYENHKAIHDTLARQAAEIIEGFRTGKIVLSLTLSRFLSDWIKNHIKVEDKRMIAFVNSSEKK